MSGFFLTSTGKSRKKNDFIPKQASSRRCISTGSLGLQVQSKVVLCHKKSFLTKMIAIDMPAITFCFNWDGWQDFGDPSYGQDFTILMDNNDSLANPGQSLILPSPAEKKSSLWNGFLVDLYRIETQNIGEHCHLVTFHWTGDDTKKLKDISPPQQVHANFSRIVNFTIIL